ncbi:MAG: hypothetical protein ACYC61_31485, partial [Isosphaeraceae bacterium]
MRGLKRLVVVSLLGGIGWSSGAAVAQLAPAAPTYVGAERTIESIRQAWARPGARPEPNADGWNSLFNTLLNELRAYSQAGDETARLSALGSVYEIEKALEGVSWSPAANLRLELREWLRPRVRLAWAARRLTETVESLPEARDAAAKSNRTRWIDFVQHDLSAALHEYDAARTVQQRRASLRRLEEALGALHQHTQATQGRGWQPAIELEAAMNDLFNRPNLDIAADVATVAPVLEATLVQSGPVTRKGYTSMVTAGPKTGFGLLPVDGGISFYNSQSMVSVTPIHDFQQQIEQDPQGQKAAQLYYFGATTYDWSNLTVTATVTPEGLNLYPSSTHNIDAAITSAPTDGAGLKRGIAALIGMGQNKITDKVKEGALPKFQQQIPVEAQEEALERISVEQAQRNADLRAKYLPGNDTAAVRDILIRQLTLASRPEAIFVSGRLEWRGLPEHLGADAPQPPRLASTIESGVTADLHLGSLLTTAAGGFWQKDQIQSVQNLVIETKAVSPETPPKDAVQVRKNVSFADYLKAVEVARKANDPRVQALRILRPQSPPEFSTDARGYLVALVRDFQLDVPAPGEQGGGLLGVPARVLRIKSPLVEVALSYQLDPSTPGALRLKGKIQEFNAGTQSEVIAINDDENQGKPLTRFQSAIVASALGTKIRTQQINLDLDTLKIPGFKIQSVSPLDPTGWARINLVRVESNPPTPQPARDVKPEPLKGPGTNPSPNPAPATEPISGRPATVPAG